MSFYGNVFYELTNAISTIVIKNSGKNSNSFIVGSDTPVSVTAIGLDNKISFDSGNTWIRLAGDDDNQVCTIYHGQPAAAKGSIKAFDVADETGSFNVTELQPGDYFQTSSFSYDSAGHVTSSGTPTYYRLPISETEKNIEELTEKVSALEDADIEINADISSLESSITEISSTVSTVSKKTDEIEDLVGPRYLLTIDDNMSVTKALGDFENFQTTGYTTFSEGIVGIKNEVKAQNSVIADSSLATKVAMQRLCDVLAQHDITIDADSLWE